MIIKNDFLIDEVRKREIQYLVHLVWTNYNSAATVAATSTTKPLDANDTAALSVDLTTGAAVVVEGVDVAVAEEPEALSLLLATSWVSTSRLLLLTSPTSLSLLSFEPTTVSPSDDDEDASVALPVPVFAVAVDELEAELLVASSDSASAGDMVSVAVAVVTSTVVGVGVASESSVLEPEAVDAEAVDAEAVDTDAEEQYEVTGSTSSDMTPTPLTVQSPRSSASMDESAR